MLANRTADRKAESRFLGIPLRFWIATAIALALGARLFVASDLISMDAFDPPAQHAAAR